MEIETGLMVLMGQMDVVNPILLVRFVMGESSRHMRAAELNDIVFAGTDARPSRNLAKCFIWTMDEKAGEYNQYEELEITRKVERDEGSSFQLMASQLKP